MTADFSKKALMRFLDTVVEKGLMNSNTAGGQKAACGKILDDVADGDDIRGIDVNTAVIRFNNRNPGVLSPNSLAEYQRRVTRAISDFIRYSENPAGFKPRSRGTQAKNGRRIEVKAERTGAGHEPVQSTPTSPVNASAGLPLSFPLRSDFLAQVVIPRDLTSDEARRLGAFLLTLATDFHPAGFSGSNA